jgi:sulfoxide reductase heme-binding subunit YedZ
MVAKSPWWLLLLCATPFGFAIYSLVFVGVGPDPGEWLMAFTGDWGIRFLLLTLSVSPLHYYFRQPVLLRSRRLLGLSSFFYASLHLMTFGHFYIAWWFLQLVEEFIQRPYITLGFLAWCCLFPLAATSTRAAVRRMGRQWKRLHKLIYIVAILVPVHFLWQSRSDFGEPLFYIFLFTVLLGWRILIALRYLKRPISAAAVLPSD